MAEWQGSKSLLPGKDMEAEKGQETGQGSKPQGLLPQHISSSQASPPKIPEQSIAS